MIKKIKILIVILCMMFFLPNYCFSDEWLKYAVVIPTTGSNASDVRNVQMYRNALAKIALSYKGTPYVWGGNTPKGFDCSGFMKMVYRRIGVDLPRVSFDQGTAGAPIKKNVKNLRTGDLIYFKQERKSGWPHHVGMYLANGWFIHCTSSKGVVIESLYTSKLTKSVKSISRILFTEKEGRFLQYAKKYGLLTADTHVYDPITGKIH